MNYWQFKAPVYPRELTNAWWQKNKGMIAKIATRDDGTGIGKQLTTLEAEFKKIKWENINLLQFMPNPIGSRTQQDIQQGVARAKQEATKAQATYQLAVKIEREATLLAADWAKSKVIPKSSTAAAKTIADKAKDLSYQVSMGTMATWVEKMVKEEQEAAKGRRANFAKILGDVPDKLDELIKNAGNGCSVEEWPNFWKQDVRFIGTMFGAIASAAPTAANDIRAMRVHASTCKKPANQQELDRWLSEIENAARGILQKLP